MSSVARQRRKTRARENAAESPFKRRSERLRRQPVVSNHSFGKVSTISAPQNRTAWSEQWHTEITPYRLSPVTDRQSLAICLDITNFVAEAKRCYRNGDWGTARCNMEYAKRLWSPALGVAEPEFNPSEMQHMTIKEIFTSKTRAYRALQLGHWVSARTQMQLAQALWTPHLPIPQPSFDEQDRCIIDTYQIRALNDEASRALEENDSLYAWILIGYASSIWRPEMGIPRPMWPDKTAKEAPLEEILSLTTAAEQLLQIGAVKEAKKTMKKARRRWHRGLDIPRPAFSPQAWQQMRDLDVSASSQNAESLFQNGLHLEAVTCMRSAQALWKKGSHLPIPTFSPTHQNIISSAFSQVGLISKCVLSGICAICLETESDGSCLRGPCGHEFHEKCITAWLSCSKAKTCPACRLEWI